MAALLWLPAMFLVLSSACGSSEGAAVLSPTMPAGTPSAAASAQASGTPGGGADSPTALATRPPGTAVGSATRLPASATPARSPTATPRPASGEVVENGPREVRTIALTFDMGGRVDPAVEIIQWLIANGVSATVFMTGEMAANQNTDAGRQVLRLIEANPGRFELGSHGYAHTDYRELTPAEMAAELRRAETAMAPYASQDLRPLFRPPFGGQDAEVVAAVAAAGYTRVVLWDIDTIDWRPESEGGPTSADIVAKVASRAQGGSIVLMHLGGYNTLEALPAMVARLREAGFRFVTVSEMLGLPR